MQELNRILFSAIEASLVGTSGKDLIGRLYHGTLVNQVRKYSQTYIKRSPLGQRKSGLIRQETS